jgi:flagellar biosynthesis component FlhA
MENTNMTTDTSIFKNVDLQIALYNDLEMIATINKVMQSEYGGRNMQQLVDNVRWEMMKNLRWDVANEIEQMSAKHTDFEIEQLIEFYQWQKNFKIVDANTFNMRMAEEVVDKDVCVQVQLYGESEDFFIEVDGNGRHYLIVENQSWSEPETSLDTMEFELFKFYKSMNGDD